MATTMPPGTDSQPWAELCLSEALPPTHAETYPHPMTESMSDRQRRALDAHLAAEDDEQAAEPNGALRPKPQLAQPQATAARLPQPKWKTPRSAKPESVGQYIGGGFTFTLLGIGLLALDLNGERIAVVMIAAFLITFGSTLVLIGVIAAGIKLGLAHAEYERTRP